MRCQASFRNWAMLLLLALTVAGCTTVGKWTGRETTVTLRIHGANDVNPNEDGRASPVILNIFELENDRQFDQEEFIALFQSAKEVLGRDLVKTYKLKELTPGELREETFTFDKRTHYIGVMAEYIRYDDASTKVVFQIDQNTGNKLDLFVDRLGMRIKD
ncbi:type VI secretion system lipoprotein TssJ [Hahella sp. KA22]|nr:type VI secretion system lipoprotein TssJ [Hahella sp. KA22]MBU6955667.1 type VI secretion system lipoprotein TssJ [Hahella sp. HN01]QAY56567.1 type VI secretion system lipoprotein TssJ [Hahella sp. KA22]